MHGQWTPEEDLELTKLFLSDGKKWSQISRKLGGSRTEHMVKNRYKTIVSKQKKLYPEIKNQYNLLKSLLNPERKEVTSEIVRPEPEEEKSQLENIKAEPKSQQEEKKEINGENIEENAELNQLIRQDQEHEKQQKQNQPQTSSAFELPQVYSPWYMGYQLTPTFSPFFVNVPTFSSFDASFSNQFYCPTRSNERSDFS